MVGAARAARAERDDGECSLKMRAVLLGKHTIGAGVQKLLHGPSGGRRLRGGWRKERPASGMSAAARRSGSGRRREGVRVDGALRLGRGRRCSQEY